MLCILAMVVTVACMAPGADYSQPQQINETRYLPSNQGLPMRDPAGNCVLIGLTAGKYQKLTYTLVDESVCTFSQQTIQ